MNDLILPDGKLIPVNQLPVDLQEKIRRYAVLDIYKDQAREIIEADQVDIDEYVEIWLSLKKSPRTKESYKKCIEDFFRYMESISTPPLLARADHVDRFLILLKDKYKSNTVRLKVSACSSFYSYIKRHDLIRINPFLGAELPRKEYKKAVQPDLNKTIPVMSREEYRIILQEIEKKKNHPGKRSCDIRTREGAGKLLLAVHFMATYALRAEAVQSVVIRKDKLLFRTKGGKSFSRPLKDETLNLLGDNPKEKPLENYGKRTMQSALKTVTEYLAGSGQIRFRYSSHDFRHYFAAEDFKEYKDIVRLKELLGHASINITDVYLQNLGVK